jgi:hypothetical protein
MESTLEPNGVKYFTYGNGPKPIVNSIPLNEMFYLWNLCGSGVENLIILNGVVKMKPPVRTLP